MKIHTDYLKKPMTTEEILKAAKLHPWTDDSYSSMKPNRGAAIIAVNSYERQRECIRELVEAAEDIESKIVAFEAGHINWRPDDFLMRVRTAIARAKELLK